MSKFKVSHSSITKKFNDSLNNTKEISEKESGVEKLEKYILQNPSDRVDDSRDQSEDLPEEDPEEESSEELEEDHEEDPEMDNKWGKVSGNEEKYILQNPSDRVDDSRDQSEDLPEEDPEEESSEELEEDHEEDPEMDNKWGKVSGNEEKYILQNPSDRVDDSRDQSEDLPEEDPEEESSEELEEDHEEDPEMDNKWGKVSGNEEKYILQNPSDRVDDSRDQSEDLPEEDPEEESSEELEEDHEEDPEMDNKWGKVSGNEEKYILQNPSDSVNDSRDQFEDLLEEDPEEESSEELEEDPEEDPEINSKWGEVPGNQVPAFSQASLYQSQKKCNQEGLRSQKLESEPSHLELAPIDKFASKEEGAGSSGKRRRSRWEPQPDGDGIKEDDQTSKRRKTRWSSDDTQIKMLGPLQQPDFTEDFVNGADKDPKIQGLKAELLEINRKLQRPLLDDRPEEERSPSPEPIYNNLGIRINTREVRLRHKLVHERQNIISKLIKLNPAFNPPPDYKPPKLFKKLYIPVKEYPDYNFVGLIIGPCGNTQKRMEKETGAKILLRGKGSLKTLSKLDTGKEDLHVYIEANSQKSLDAAVGMVEKLLIPIEEGRNEHKQAQLKELAMLKGTLRDENVCSVCGDQGHKHYACPNLQSTFKMTSFDTCCSNILSTPTCPVTALFPQSDSVQGSGFSRSSMQNRQTRPGKEISDKHLYVGYLPQSIDESRLTELFSPFGKITEAKVVKDRTTGISRGFGFVTFEDSKDAAVAVAHLNGFKIDGKYLRVRIAGLQPNNESPILSLIPQKPGPAAVSSNITSQADWSGPLHFMLPEHQSSFHDSSGTKMFSCSINSEHGDPKKSLVFTPPGNTLNHPDFSYSSNMHHFSGNFSGRSLFSSDNSTTQFSSDPGNLGSQFRSYFMTPTFKTATFSNSDHRRERKI